MLRSSLLAIAVGMIGCGSGADPAPSTMPSDASQDGTADAKGDAPGDAVAEPKLDGSSDGKDAWPGDAAQEVHPEAAPPAPLGNALLLPDGGVTPLYRIEDPDSPTPAVAYQSNGDTIESLDEQGATLWEKSFGPGSMFGGFDFDGDQWPDLGLVRSQDTGETCGGKPVLMTSIDVVRGRTGDMLAAVSPLKSLCWTFGTTTYPTEQWTGLDLLFGKGTKTLAAIPYYATTGWYYAFDGTSLVQTGSLLYPSTSAYDTTYTNDKPNAHGLGHSFEEYSHVPNGLIHEVGGEPRLVVFTTARVAQYRLTDLAADQLAADTPFLTANRTDLVGRDYGLVVPDPEYPTHVVLLSGTSAASVFFDQVSGKMESDPWGQIERHLTIYDVGSAAVDDRFFSYAHDSNDGFKYEGRLAYPNHPMVRRGAGTPSRLAYNVYEGGHWRLHVSKPGVTADEVVFADWFLWDIQDIDQDGDEDWVLSPSRDPTDPDVPGWYFVKWRTVLASWNEGALKFDEVRKEEGVIPHLVGAFREPGKTTSWGALYPVLTVGTSTGLQMVTAAPGGVIGFLPLSP
ncbi:MAG: hypothetical protein HY898_29330 [Deltaproteobacteria bacterium]|nr:hypothetical protein [Deltaproteobacteria bacterium]